jgi:hypothetical protein
MAVRVQTSAGRLLLIHAIVCRLSFMLLLLTVKVRLFTSSVNNTVCIRVRSGRCCSSSRKLILMAMVTICSTSRGLLAKSNFDQNGP